MGKLKTRCKLRSVLNILWWGMRDVDRISELYLTHYDENSLGVIVVIWEHVK
jgi:hypothetical protein